MSRKKVTDAVDFLGISSRIREVRGKLTQKGFGEIFGVRDATISRYESGRIPDVATLKKIADFGGVTVEWLLYGDQAAGQPQLREYAPETYDAGPLPPLAEGIVTEVIAAVEDYYARHRLKRRPIQKARLISRLYQHYAETREKPDDVLIKGNLTLAD